jgi:hypothetical protein
MTRLAEEIENVMLQCIKEGNENTTYWAHRIAEEVAKRYIDKALHADLNETRYSMLIGKTMSEIREENRERWLKENGITE